MAERMDVTFDAPDELRKSIEKKVRYFVGLMPRWVEHLYVTYRYEAPETGCVADVLTQYEYRKAHLRIYPAWIGLTDKERVENMAHEAVHVLLAPFLQYVECTSKGLTENRPEVMAMFKSGIDLANEAATQDVARALLNLADRVSDE